MKWLKALFGGGDTATATRSLNHPDQIRAGDIIQFKYMDLVETSGKTFEVSQVNTYIYGDICYPELVLKDREGLLLYAMVEDEDGDEYLTLSKKISKGDIQTVLSPEALQALQDQGLGYAASANVLPDLSAWMQSQYKTVDKLKGAFVKGDARELSEAEFRKRDYFTSYLLETPDEEFALELEVYASGELELCATRYFDLTEIEYMWPAKSTQVTP